MDISDEQWAVVRRFLPGPERLRTSGKGGRPWRDPVADELISPCPLVAEAGALLAKAKPSKEGLVSRRDRRCLDVHVSPAILGRALRILDALLKGLEQRGYTIETTVPRKEERTDYYGRREQIEHPTRTLVHIGGEEIAFDLAEETEFTRPPAKRPPPDPDHKVYWAWRNAPLPPRRATGALTLSMKDVCDVGRKSWTDCVKRGEADVLLSRRSGSPEDTDLERISLRSPRIKYLRDLFVIESGAQTQLRTLSVLTACEYRQRLAPQRFQLRPFWR